MVGATTGGLREVANMTSSRLTRGQRGRWVIRGLILLIDFYLEAKLGLSMVLFKFILFLEER